MMMLPIGMQVTSNSDSRGFTLIELVLVILFISIITALSTPLFKNTFSELELKNTTFNLSKIINYAQEMAIIDKASYKLNFDFDGGAYWLTKSYFVDGKQTFTKLEGKYGRKFYFPDGLVFTASKKEIVLYPDGRSDTAEINIVDKNGRGRSLKVASFGSQVEIEEISNE